MHSWNVTTWYRFYYSGCIGPYFYEIDINLDIYSERLMSMISNFLVV